MEKYLHIGVNAEESAVAHIVKQQLVCVELTGVRRDRQDILGLLI